MCAHGGGGTSDPLFGWFNRLIKANILRTTLLVTGSHVIYISFLAFPTIQSDWYYYRSPLSEQVLRQQGTLAWGCYVRAMVSATDP